MLNDPLASAFSKIMNAEKSAKSECIISPVSKIITRMLEIMKDKNYIGDFKIIEDNKGNKIKISLLGKINKIQVIKPRYPVNKEGYEKFEKRYLPSKDFGIIFVSTSQGILMHNQAKEKEIGGRLLAYVY